MSYSIVSFHRLHHELPALSNPNPDFIALLNTDSVRAGNEFADFALKFFTIINPKFLRHLNPDDRKEIEQEILLHCTSNNLRVLRNYRPLPKGFGAWFYMVSYNRTIDIQRMRSHESSLNKVSPLESETVSIQHADSLLLSRDLLFATDKAIKSMNRYCQILLRMASSEFTPIEIVRVLRWSRVKSKKVSDDLRACRKKLKKMLEQFNLESSNFSR